MKYSFKSDKMRKQNDKPIEKVVEAAMSVKIKDERYHQRELHRRRDNKKKRLGEQHHPKKKVQEDNSVPKTRSRRNEENAEGELQAEDKAHSR